MTTDLCFRLIGLINSSRRRALPTTTTPTESAARVVLWPWPELGWRAVDNVMCPSSLDCWAAGGQKRRPVGGKRALGRGGAIVIFSRAKKNCKHVYRSRKININRRCCLLNKYKLTRSESGPLHAGWLHWQVWVHKEKDTPVGRSGEGIYWWNFVSYWNDLKTNNVYISCWSVLSWEHQPVDRSKRKIILKVRRRERIVARGCLRTDTCRRKTINESAVAAEKRRTKINSITEQISSLMARDGTGRDVASQVRLPYGMGRTEVTWEHVLWSTSLIMDGYVSSFRLVRKQQPWTFMWQTININQQQCIELCMFCVIRWYGMVSVCLLVYQRVGPSFNINNNQPAK